MELMIAEKQLLELALATPAAKKDLYSKTEYDEVLNQCAHFTQKFLILMRKIQQPTPLNQTKTHPVRLEVNMID